MFAVSNTIVKTVGVNLRRLREQRGRSLSDVARAAAVAKATLSELEAGRGNPTVETLAALATALDVPLGDLLAAPGPEPVVVVRAGEGTFVPGTANDLRLIQRLQPPGPLELYEATWPERSVRNAGAHGPGTVEHVLVLKGRLRVGPPGREVELRTGDLASFGADEPHVYDARVAGTRALLLMQWGGGQAAAARALET